MKTARRAVRTKQGVLLGDQAAMGSASMIKAAGPWCGETETADRTEFPKPDQRTRSADVRRVSSQSAGAERHVNK